MNPKKFYINIELKNYLSVDDSGIIKGLITSKDITNNADFPNASKDKKGRPLVGAAVGVKGDFLERSESLLEAGTDVLGC